MHAKPRPNKSGIWKLRLATQQDRIARMLFAGISTAKIAQALRCSTDTIRSLVGTPEFQSVYQQYEREQLATIDRSLPKLLVESIRALHRNLVSQDWRARQAAVDLLWTRDGRIFQHSLQRLVDVLTPPGTVTLLPHQLGVIDETQMSDEVREKARALLRLTRKAFTRPQRQAKRERRTARR